MLPLTDQTVVDITRRLGPVFTKHTWTSLVHWDPSNSKFFAASTISGYRFTNIWFVYYFGYFVLLGFIAFTYFLSSQDIKDVVHSSSDTLLTFSMLLYTTCMAAIVWFGTVFLEYQEECVDTFNASFSLDSRLKSLIPVKITTEEAKYSDIITKLCCYPPLVIPFIFLLALFHPLDPLHIFIERVLEVKVDFNWNVLVFLGLEFYGVYVLLATVTIVLLMGWVTTLVSVYWLGVVMPAKITTGKTGKCQVWTESGMELDPKTVVGVYRALQCFVAIPNRIVTHPQYVAHSIAMLMVWVTSAFVVIRYNDIMLDGSPMGLSMVVIFVAACVIGAGVYYAECFLLDLLEKKWTSYKSGILAQTSRKSGFYKTGLSFRPVTLHLGGMFYNINKSTYLEWIEAGIDNLTTLLCSF